MLCYTIGFFHSCHLGKAPWGTAQMFEDVLNISETNIIYVCCKYNYVNTGSRLKDLICWVKIQTPFPTLSSETKSTCSSESILTGAWPLLATKEGDRSK